MESGPTDNSNTLGDWKKGISAFPLHKKIVLWAQEKKGQERGILRHNGSTKKIKRGNKQTNGSSTAKRTSCRKR